MSEAVRPPDPDSPIVTASPDVASAGPEGDGQARVEVICGGCRRGLRIREEYLGRFVVCQHCGQRFIARMAWAPDEPPSAPGPFDSRTMTVPPIREGVPTGPDDGLAKLVARIRRESALERSLAGPRVGPRSGIRDAAASRRVLGAPDDGLAIERDRALADASRLSAELDELRSLLAELESRFAAQAKQIEADTARPKPEPEPQADPAVIAARIGAIEAELAQARSELASRASLRAEERLRLDRERAEADGRWEAERSAHSEAIDRAVLAERARGVAEVEGLVARADRDRIAAEEVRRDRDAAIHRAEGLQREQDEIFEERVELDGRVKALEARLQGQGMESESAVEEARRLHQDEVARLTEALEQARGREQAIEGRISELEAEASGLKTAQRLEREFAKSAVEEARRLHQDEVARLTEALDQATGREQTAGGRVIESEAVVSGLQSALRQERERAEADRKALEDDRDARVAALTEELDEARSIEELGVARLVDLEAQVERLLSQARRDAERVEKSVEAARRAELDRAGLESEIARLRLELVEAERSRDIEREKAAGLAREAEELVVRLEKVEAAQETHRRDGAESARLSAELALVREEAASASRHNVLLLQELGLLRAEWAASREEGAGPRERPAPPVLESQSRGKPTPVEGPRVEIAGTAPARADLPIPATLPPAPVAVVRDSTVISTPIDRVRKTRGATAIVLRGVTKEYRRNQFRIPVLETLDLEVEQGEFLALMGPSGSGKTTLLNLIAGLDSPTNGSIVVHGQELAGLSEASLTRWRSQNVGFVFQMYNLVPIMTAFRNVELPLLLTRLSRRQRRENAMTALRLVGLEGREFHYPRQLSGGQEQRVSIARAIVTDPQLIVADEPTGDLDRKSALEILDLLGSLNREFGKTIVMVTHDPTAATRATRTLHLDKGKLVGDTVPPRIWVAS